MAIAAPAAAAVRARPPAMQLRTAVAATVAGQEAVLRAALFAEREGVAPFDPVPPRHLHGLSARQRGLPP